MTPCLLAEDVWKRYGRSGRWVLQGVSFGIRPGELISITGENGSGKSTLLGILAGELEPSQGKVSRSASVGYCPQLPALYPRLTVGEHFSLYGTAAKLDAGHVGRVRDQTLATLNCSQYSDVQIRDLSGGTRAKLNLALSMLGDPAVLILDEPYAAFDLSSYQAFWGLVEQQKAVGRAIVIVSHFDVDADRFDRRWQLADGTIGE